MRLDEYLRLIAGAFVLLAVVLARQCILIGIILPLSSP